MCIRDRSSTSARLRVVYHLYNGSTVTRSYYGLALPEDGAEQFRDLYSNAEALEQKNPCLLYTSRCV